MPTRDDFRQLEFEDNAASQLSRPRNRASKGVSVLVGGVTVAFVVWMMWTGNKVPARAMTAADGDDFRTTQYRAPVIDTPAPALDQGRIVLTPPPAPPSPPQAPPAAPPADSAPQFPPLNPPGVVAPPPTLAQPNDDEDARRRTEEERRRLAEEERQKWERLKSPMVVTDAGFNVAAGPVNDASGASQKAYDETDGNSRYLNNRSQAGVDIARATKNRRTDALIAQGTMIRGVLETAIQSDLPGMVRAVTTEDVWSFDGRRVIVPSGSRLIGEYKSGLAIGQTRVFIVWTRILRQDGVSVQLGSPGTDNLGRTGLEGEVDNHYFERFGSAIMLSIVGGGSAYLAQLGQNTQSYNSTSTSTFNPATGTYVTSTSQPGNQQDAYARELAAQQVSQTMTQIANEALKNSINIPPTINVDQGARIMIFVRRDLDFSSFYPDPLREMIKELRHGRVRPDDAVGSSSNGAFDPGLAAPQRMVRKP